MRCSLFESHDQLAAVFAGRDGDRAGAHSAHPGLAAGLNNFQCVIKQGDGFSEVRVVG